MRAFIIGCEIDPIVVGETYDSFPLHCTLVHWFKTNKSYQDIDELIRPALKKVSPFTVTSVTPAMYGPNFDIPVHLIKKTTTLDSLHKQLVSALEPCNPTHTIPYIGDGYGPHVTDTDKQALTPGESHTITNIYLLEALDPEDTRMRKVIKKYRL